MEKIQEIAELFDLITAYTQYKLVTEKDSSKTDIFAYALMENIKPIFSNLADGVLTSSCYDRRKNSGFIAINQNLNRNEQRVLLAEELGSCFYASNPFEAYENIRMKDEQETIEVIASKLFAASFLVPKEEFVNYYNTMAFLNHTDELEDENLANYFGVTEEIIQTRKQCLNHLLAKQSTKAKKKEKIK